MVRYDHEDGIFSERAGFDGRPQPACQRIEGFQFIGQDSWVVDGMSRVIDGAGEEIEIGDVRVVERGDQLVFRLFGEPFA